MALNFTVAIVGYIVVANALFVLLPAIFIGKEGWKQQ
jgi:hypothetical protein